MQHASVSRQFIEAPKHADFPETTWEYSHNVVPQGVTYLCAYTWSDPTSALFCWLWISCFLCQLHPLVANSIHHFLTWLLIILSLPCCSYFKGLLGSLLSKILLLCLVSWITSLPCSCHRNQKPVSDTSSTTNSCPAGSSNSFSSTSPCTGRMEEKTTRAPTP